MVDPRQCSVARAVIMEHYRILGLACVVPGPGPGHCSGGNRGELGGYLLSRCLQHSCENIN